MFFCMIKILKYQLILNLSEISLKNKKQAFQFHGQKNELLLMFEIKNVQKSTKRA